MQTADRSRVDRLFQYALAIAALSEDWKQRELGPIHLLKYAYLADVAHAEHHDGSTFTGIEWVFHHFGPWTAEAHKRIESALDQVGAAARTFTSESGADGVRYGLPHDRARQLADDLDRRLPPALRHAVASAVREHGSDTADLLRRVYLTSPMLAAGPDEVLRFTTCREREASPPRASGSGSVPKREQRRRAAILEAARQEMQRRLAEKRKKRVAPDPPPRYDEVFHEGTRWLDREAGEPVRPSSGTLQFDDSVWTSSQRREDSVP